MPAELQAQPSASSAADSLSRDDEAAIMEAIGGADAFAILSEARRAQTIQEGDGNAAIMGASGLTFNFAAPAAAPAEDDDVVPLGGVDDTVTLCPSHLTDQALGDTTEQTQMDTKKMMSQLQTGELAKRSKKKRKKKSRHAHHETQAAAPAKRGDELLWRDTWTRAGAVRDETDAAVVWRGGWCESACVMTIMRATNNAVVSRLCSV
jgi:hypothetical protein